MLRTPAQRASLLKAWKSDPRNKGLQPPVEIRAPGIDAPKKARGYQVNEVRELLRKQLDDLKRLEQNEVRLMLPVLKHAERELAAKLKSWTERTPDGELRWTAHSYRKSLVQIKTIVGHIEDGMRERLERGAEKAQRLALDHLVEEVARFSQIFDGGMPVKLQLNLARLITTEKSMIIPRIETSAARYAWSPNPRVGVFADIKLRLASDILQGASVSQMTDNLQAHGGPRGWVYTHGMEGWDTAILEHIPEGLFARYRYRAEMVVRTELAAAYGAQAMDGMTVVRNRWLPDLQKRWCSYGTGCKEICDPADGQVVDLEDVFKLGDGSTTDTSPAHPNCMCRVGSWRPHWGKLLDSLPD